MSTAHTHVAVNSTVATKPSYTRLVNNLSAIMLASRWHPKSQIVPLASNSVPKRAQHCPENGPSTVWNKFTYVLERALKLDGPFWMAFCGPAEGKHQSGKTPDLSPYEKDQPNEIHHAPRDGFIQVAELVLMVID